MLKIEKLVLGVFKVNCYILSLEDTNIIIDPGEDFDCIEKYLQGKRIKPDFIINTHGHYDHIGAVPDLILKYKIPFYIHKLEESIILDPEKNLSSFFGGNGLSLKTYNLIEENYCSNFNNLGIEIINTPGHTPGSIVLRYKNFLFTGDLLFKGAIGRTDLPGGDISKIRDSLAVIKEMDKDLTVYPGHGEDSILKYELKNNYYLQDNFLSK